MKKLVLALACRNNGSRLYGKPLQSLDIKSGLTIMDNIINSLKKVKCVKDIVLGISKGVENEDFVKYAKFNNIKYIRGNEIDVLSRLIKCGKKTSASDILRITSESPFPYVEKIQKLWKYHCKNENDATFLDEIIDGCSFEIISLKSLIKSHKKGTKKHKSELCTLYIRENIKQFKVKIFKPNKNLIRKDLRLTVDYPEDLIVCREIYKFVKKNKKSKLLDKIKFLDKRNDLKKLIKPYCEEGYSTMYIKK